MDRNDLFNSNMTAEGHGMILLVITEITRTTTGYLYTTLDTKNNWIFRYLGLNLI